METVRATVVATVEEYERASRGAVWAIRDESGETIHGIAFRCPGCGFPGQVPVIPGTRWQMHSLSGWPDAPTLAGQIEHRAMANPGVGCGWTGSLTNGTWQGSGGLPAGQGWDGERYKEVVDSLELKIT